MQLVAVENKAGPSVWPDDVSNANIHLTNTKALPLLCKACQHMCIKAI